MTTKTNLNDDFRAYLRQELLKQQDRRAEHVKSKFTFIVGLGGLAAALQPINFEEPLVINLLVYSIPLIAALFDFYILGGEFAVKRIRSFLVHQDVEHNSEILWTSFVDTWPKDFMRMNRSMTTGFVNLACIVVSIGNLIKYKQHVYHWMLFVAWCLLIAWLFVYLILIERHIRASFTKAVRDANHASEHSDIPLLLKLRLNPKTIR